MLLGPLFLQFPDSSSITVVEKHFHKISATAVVESLILLVVATEE
jgi:hypothetical protein